MMDDFDQFWAVYPRRVSRGDARKAWAQTAAIRPPLEELLASLERCKASVDWHEANREGRIGAYIPYPATWLRAEGWADDHTVRLPSVGSNRLPARNTDPVPPRDEPTEEQRAEVERQKREAIEAMKNFRLKRIA